MIPLSLIAALALAAGDQPGAESQAQAVQFRPRGEPDIILQGVLHVPGEAEGPIAGMVICHPDPRMLGTMDDTVVMACVRALVGRGIAVLRFNFRGVGGSTGSFDGGVGEINDVLGALDCLRQQKVADRDRLFLGGYSFGSVMALKALPGSGDVLAYAAVALPFVGAPEQQEEFDFVRDVRVPLFVVIGETDEYGSAEAIRTLFAERQVKGEVVVIPEADHFFATPPDALERAAGALADFIDRRAAPASVP